MPIDQAALDIAVRRFPYRLALIRVAVDHPDRWFVSEELQRSITAEYRRVLKEKEKGGLS